MFLQAEETDGATFAQPLRRYANMVADDMRMSHRGTLANGKLKLGKAVTSQPQVGHCVDSYWPPVQAFATCWDWSQ